MDKYTKAVLTVIVLSMLALPVKAEEKVWYCDMQSLAQADESGGNLYKTERFTMKVTPTQIVFGSDGVLEDMTLKINRYTNENDFAVLHLATAAVFLNGKLHIATAHTEWAVAISARCENF